ncbi:MAG: hypothetical protein LRY43_02380 [Gammaproteobacteria bacterium]|nr:hypothetical protein [Gammaproteobacteria bacterium]
MSLKEILVPDLGGADHVDVIELNVKLGDIVALDQGIVTLESDKATMEVPATSAGTIKEIFVNIGDKLSEGQKVVAIETQEMINKETISSKCFIEKCAFSNKPAIHNADYSRYYKPLTRCTTADKNSRSECDQSTLSCDPYGTSISE